MRLKKNVHILQLFNNKNLQYILTTFLPVDTLMFLERISVLYPDKLPTPQCRGRRTLQPFRYRLIFDWI